MFSKKSKSDNGGSILLRTTGNYSPRNTLTILITARSSKLIILELFSAKTHRRTNKTNLTLKSSVVTICTTRFNIQKVYVLPTLCIYVFSVDMRTNSDYFTVQH